jgi:hypothetical protein
VQNYISEGETYQLYNWKQRRMKRERGKDLGGRVRRVRIKIGEIIKNGKYRKLDLWKDRGNMGKIMQKFSCLS